MTLKQLPIIPTIIVLAAATTMVGLGFWQIGRAEEKGVLIAAYKAALDDEAVVEWPLPERYSETLYRRASVNCGQVRGFDSIGGKSARGQTGWVHIARCQHRGGEVADVTMGWSLSTEPPSWDGGEVIGRIAPYGDVVRLIPDQPVAGLELLAKPDPNDLPNNHIAYAGQWFFFAITALVIYFLALQSRAAKRRRSQ